MKVRVKAGWQVNHEGKNLTDGEEFEANDSDAKRWVEAGYVERVSEPRKTEAQTQARAGGEVKDKSSAAKSKPRSVSKPDDK